VRADDKWGKSRPGGLWESPKKKGSNCPGRALKSVRGSRGEGGVWHDITWQSKKRIRSIKGTARGERGVQAGKRQNGRLKQLKKKKKAGLSGKDKVFKKKKQKNIIRKTPEKRRKRPVLSERAERRG